MAYIVLLGLFVACGKVVACGKTVSEATPPPGEIGGEGGMVSATNGAAGCAGTAAGGETGASGGISSSGGSPAGGQPDGNDGGGAGTGGTTAAGPVLYRACTINDEAIPRLNVYRADEVASTCTILTLERSGFASCALFASGDWCLYQARLSRDLKVCSVGGSSQDFAEASAASGTFTIGPDEVEFDLTLTFPQADGLPRTLDVEVSECRTDCAELDCRH